MAQPQPPVTDTEQQIVAEPIRHGIDLTINNKSFRHTGDPDMPLLWYLRDVLRLTGTKYGGAGSGLDLVLINGKLAAAGSTAMSMLGGKRVVTVEGMEATDGSLHPLQQAFIDEDAVGCGYCTPGWLIAALELVTRKPHPDDSDIDQLPVLCRCGCHPRVRAAIKRATTDHEA